MEIQIANLNSLDKFSQILAHHLTPSDILLFTGQIGVGKTTLIKALSFHLGIKDIVSSPSFTLINKYQEKNLIIYHIDLYRLENSEDLFLIDIPHYLNQSNSIVFIEWAEKLSSLLPANYLKINIEYKSANSRLINLFPQGKKYNNMAKSTILEMKKDK